MPLTEENVTLFIIGADATLLKMAYCEDRARHSDEKLLHAAFR
jgi:hypothetical protein